MKTNSRASGRLLARNTLWHLRGAGAALAVLALAGLPAGSAVQGFLLLDALESPAGEAIVVIAGK
jgi:hypothetical protein